MQAPSSDSAAGSRAPKTPPKATTAKGEGERGLLADLLGLARLWPYLRANKTMVLCAAALIPVISAVQTVTPLILRHAIDKGIIDHDSSALFTGSALFLGAVLAEYLARSGQSVATALAVHRMIRTMREKLFVHVLELRAAFHDKSLSGALVTRATGDFDNLSESLNMGVLTSVVDIAVLIGCVIGMFVLNWRLALTTLVILPVVGFAVQWFARKLKIAMLSARVKIAALNAFTQECFYGHATVKLLTSEPEAAKRYEKLNIEFRDAQMSSVVLDALMFSVLDGIASVTLGVILWLVVGRYVGDGDNHAGSMVSAGVLVAFVQYIQQLFEPLKQLGNKMAMLQGAFASLDRIFGIFARDEKIAGDVQLGALRGEVEFRNVSFSYAGMNAVDAAGVTTVQTAAPVLRHVSLKLPAGQTMALVGATGSGKSTLAKLIAKLYADYTGDILIDGQDLRLLSPKDLRRQMAIVPQDIVLFDGTVAFNIGLGQPEVSQERIVQAAREVGADQFINRLAHGFDEEIREGGTNLSHGQRQLLAFARALVRDPGLVILDEATSSVDPESEAVIQAAIARILKNRTVIVIAHRLSTIRQCDQILVMRSGEVIESGRHDELVAAKGAYFGLHAAFA